MGPAIPLVLTAVSAAAATANARATAKRADKAVAAGINKQRERQREADTLTNAAIQKQQGSRSTGDATALNQQLQAAQQSQLQNAVSGLKQPGAVSDRVAGEASDAALGVNDKTSVLADLLSRIDAGANQRQREGIDLGRLSTDLGLVRRQANADDFLNQLRVQSVQRSPLLDFLSQTAGAAAQASAARGTGFSSPGTSLAPVRAQVPLVNLPRPSFTGFGGGP